MKKLLPLLFFCVFAFSLAYPQPQNSPVAGGEASFMNQAYMDNLIEIETGNLALKHAKEGGVKSFGSQMAADHKQINNKLKQLMVKKGYTISVDTTNVPVDKKLAASSGADFDNLYIAAMVNANTQLIASYQNALRRFTDPDVANFIRKTLQLFKAHLSSAKAIAAQQKIKPLSH